MIIAGSSLGDNGHVSKYRSNKQVFHGFYARDKLCTGKITSFSLFQHLNRHALKQVSILPASVAEKERIIFKI